MSFRSNAFGEKIAQPETTLDEIEQMIAAREFFDEIEVGSADLFVNGDDQFKFGGTLYFNMKTIHEPEDEDEEPEEDWNDVSVEFDGFESMEAARQWVIDEIGVYATSINEVE